MNYKEKFIEFMVRANVLKFGEFTLKSGRVAPYFINTGAYEHGGQISKLGEFYAECFRENVKNSPPGRGGTVGDGVVLYGPAYKGIPLVLTTAAQLKLPYFFNRKEAKDHGEGGVFMGHQPKAGEEVVIIEDVITAGTAFRESVELLQPTGVKIKAIIVSVDRMERGKTEKSALQEVREAGVAAFSIVNLDDIVNYLHNREIDGKILITDEILEKINEYRKIYGVS